jgi:hypothetical protein
MKPPALRAAAYPRRSAFSGIIRFSHEERIPMATPLIFLLLLLTVASFGCGTVSYKLGGTHSDQQAAHDRCQNAGRAEGPDFDRCMEEQGWIVKQLGGPTAPSDAKMSAVAKSVSAGSQSSPAADLAPSSKLSDAPSAKHPTVVKTWFKFGGTADELDAAKERCVAKLGAAHRPEPESHLVTGEMLDCLRNEGWRGLQSR